jgi:hypothetical protein
MRSRVASTLLTLGLLGGALTTSLGSAGTATADAAAPPVAIRTVVTLAVKGCNGCTFRLTQAHLDPTKVWQSKSKKVRDASVTFSVPTKRTHGMSITVLAPWDGGAGYVPVVAFKYAGLHIGQKVTNATARTKKRASSCWAGTSDDLVVLPIRVVHATATNPPGARIKTPRAFTTVTQRWEKPMSRVWHGIAGTQDAIYCG